MRNEDFTYESFYDAVTEIDEAFKKQYDEHLQYYNELLPHVLMADLTRHILNEFEIYIGANLSQKLYRLLELLELGILSKDERLANLVAVSFVENLLGYKNIPHLYKYLGRGLQAQLINIGYCKE